MVNAGEQVGNKTATSWHGAQPHLWKESSSSLKTIASAPDWCASLVRTKTDIKISAINDKCKLSNSALLPFFFCQALREFSTLGVFSSARWNEPTRPYKARTCEPRTAVATSCTTLQHDVYFSRWQPNRVTGPHLLQNPPHPLQILRKSSISSIASSATVLDARETGAISRQGHLAPQRLRAQRAFIGDGAVVLGHEALSC